MLRDVEGPVRMCLLLGINQTKPNQTRNEVLAAQAQETWKRPEEHRKYGGLVDSPL